MKDYQIGPGDLATVRQLIKLWQKEEPATVELTPKSIILLAKTLNNKPLGFVSANRKIVDTDKPVAFKKGDKFLDVSGLYVRPEYRGKGLGSQLLGAIEREALKRKITRLALYTGKPDFYKRLGYALRYAYMAHTLKKPTK